MVDNLSGGKRKRVPAVARLYEGDVRDFEKLVPLFQGIDYVSHLAAFLRIQPSILGN